MKALAKIILAATAYSVASAAYAVSAPQQSASPSNQSRELVRADVKADLAIWKQAGMDKFWRGENTPDIYSRQYRLAEAEYRRMRQGY
jgi:hypothetical protein